MNKVSSIFEMPSHSFDSTTVMAQESSRRSCRHDASPVHERTVISKWNNSFWSCLQPMDLCESADFVVFLEMGLTSSFKLFRMLVPLFSLWKSSPLS